MATDTQSHGLILVQGYRSSGGSRTQLFRVAAPMLYAAMGVSLGTLTGVTAAFKSVPSGKATEAVSATIGRASNVAITAPAANTGPTIKMASVAQTIGVSGRSTSESESANARSGISAPVVHRTVNAKRPPILDNLPAEAPAVDKDTARPASPAENRPARHLAHPVTRPARTVLASMPEVSPVPLDEQLSFVEPKPATFYSEGDATVADYDAAVGTIQTSDGKTFALGETVSEVDATSWDQYRSNVHYRCGEGGSCVVLRAGVVAANAREI